VNCSELNAEIKRIAWLIIDLAPEERTNVLRQETLQLPLDAQDAILAYSTLKALTMSKPDVNWEKIAAFACGVIFLVTLLIIAITVPTPSSFQAFIFRVVLSVAAAAFIALVPGFINVETKFKGFWVRAGGALAIFVIVYLMNPPALIQGKQGDKSSDQITHAEAPK
jgi:Na+-transporting NADH:ubiquinone oxidoreductase subunit NqrB